MRLKQFYNSKACNSGLHCSTCRALTPEGEAWRTSVTGQPSFSCPKGKVEGVKDRKVWRGWKRKLYVGPGDLVYHAGRLAGIGPWYERRMASRGTPCACNRRRSAWNTMGWRGAVLNLYRAVSTRIRSAR